jgi:hypothetical protein
MTTSTAIRAPSRPTARSSPPPVSRCCSHRRGDALPRATAVPCRPARDSASTRRRVPPWPLPWCRHRRPQAVQHCPAAGGTVRQEGLSATDGLRNMTRSWPCRSRSSAARRCVPQTAWHCLRATPTCRRRTCRGTPPATPPETHRNGNLPTVTGFCRPRKRSRRRARPQRLEDGLCCSAASVRPAGAASPRRTGAGGPCGEPPGRRATHRQCRNQCCERALTGGH